MYNFAFEQHSLHLSLRCLLQWHCSKLHTPAQVQAWMRVVAAAPLAASNSKYVQLASPRY